MKSLPLLFAALGCSLFSLFAQGAAIEARSPDEQERGNFGYRVLAISDLNSDGTPELAVTALHVTDPRGARGAVFILNGRNFSLIRRFDPPYADDDKIADQGSFGSSLAEIVDLDGDGVRELVAGAVYADRPDLLALGYGQAYVLNPATGAIVRTLSAPRPRRGTFFGVSVASLSTTAPGQKARIAVGAPADPAGGAVHLFDAASGELILTFQSLAPEAQDWFGASLAEIGDVDSDGRADLAVGAGSEDNENNSSFGAAFIASGQTGEVLHQLIPPDVSPDVRFRWSVVAVPDVNGDGKTDVLVGLALGWAPDDLFTSGRACLFSGADGKWLRTLVSPQPRERGWFGWSVAGLPDVTGDGAGELLIGCAGHPGQGFNTYGERRVYLMNGATGQFIQSFESPHGGEGFGLSITGVLDQKGKLRTIVVGAPHDSPAASPFRSGRVYAFPLSLSNLTAARSGEGIRLSLASTAEKSYQIQASKDLASWQTLTTLKATAEPVTYLDAQSNDLERRFYRAVEATTSP